MATSGSTLPKTNPILDLAAPLGTRKLIEESCADNDVGVLEAVTQAMRTSTSICDYSELASILKVHCSLQPK